MMIGDNLRFVDPYSDIRFRVVLAQGSKKLTDIFIRPGEVRQSNDTSVAIGYYPLTTTEQIVPGVERWLNSTDFKEHFPETGEDVKVMGLLHKSTLDLTVAMPLLTRYIASAEQYFDRKQTLKNIKTNVCEIFEQAFKNINIFCKELAQGKDPIC